MFAISNENVIMCWFCHYSLLTLTFLSLILSDALSFVLQQSEDSTSDEGSSGLDCSTLGVSALHALKCLL